MTFSLRVDEEIIIIIVVDLHMITLSYLCALLLNIIILMISACAENIMKICCMRSQSVGSKKIQSSNANSHSTTNIHRFEHISTSKFRR